MANTPPYVTMNEHLFPLIDLVIDEAIEEDEAEITCYKGCDHCCHLLIEITWEEALELATWINSQDEERKQHFINTVKSNADDARVLFDNYRKARKFMEPYEGEKEIPEDVFDAYFYDKKRPCPMLLEGVCQAYTHRPSPCRFHVVTTPEEYCRMDFDDNDEEVETPEAVEEAKDEMEHVITVVNSDPKWGHFGIVLEAALEEVMSPLEETEEVE